VLKVSRGWVLKVSRGWVLKVSRGWVLKVCWVFFFPKTWPKTPFVCSVQKKTSFCQEEKLKFS
jgi:hypothetical protein